MELENSYDLARSYIEEHRSRLDAETYRRLLWLVDYREIMEMRIPSRFFDLYLDNNSTKLLEPAVTYLNTKMRIYMLKLFQASGYDAMFKLNRGTGGRWFSLQSFLYSFPLYPKEDKLQSFQLEWMLDNGYAKKI